MNIRRFGSSGDYRLPIGVLSLAILVVSATGCLNSSSIPPSGTASSQLSRKLLPFVHFEDGAVLFIAVDTRAARYVEDETIFPIGIGLANQSQGSLEFHRESFVLQSADGSRYPLAGIEEFNRDYGRSRSDARLSDSFSGAMATRFINYNRARRELFPFKGSSSTAGSSFSLGRRDWTQFYVYFPIPDGGIQGQPLKLLLDMPDVEETFVVNFVVE